VYVFVVEGRREKDSDGDDIGEASNVATPTTKELALEEKKVRGKSSSRFVEEQSDDDVWEDAAFACI